MTENKHAPRVPRQAWDNYIYYSVRQFAGYQHPLNGHDIELISKIALEEYGVKITNKKLKVVDEKKFTLFLLRYS